MGQTKTSMGQSYSEATSSARMRVCDSALKISLTTFYKDKLSLQERANGETVEVWTFCLVSSLYRILRLGELHVLEAWFWVWQCERWWSKVIR